MAGVSGGPPADLTAEVAAGVAAVRERLLAAGGAGVRLVAVTKGFGPEVVDAVRAAGVDDVGESYAQELVAKAPRVRPGARWHFVGRLQTNKVRQLAPLVHLWQSVDRPRLAEEVARRAPGAAVLVQVDVTGDPAKGGCPPAEVPALVARCRQLGLDVAGLMAGPPARGAGEAPFRAVAALADRLDLRERSMGMTEDLEAAVAAGATMVRIGRGLFPGVRRSGPRAP
jgi:uncharacterized pyridoxal phosphate-containing UPF0001 family protein